MLNLIVWIIFGALTGWIASLIMQTNDRQGLFGDVIVGIGGAIVGGFIAQLFGIDAAAGFNLVGLLTAIAGAVVILAVVRAFHRA